MSVCEKARVRGWRKGEEPREKERERERVRERENPLGTELCPDWRRGGWTEDSSGDGDRHRSLGRPEREGR